jgi:hypothetical protein
MALKKDILDDFFSNGKEPKTKRFLHHNNAKDSPADQATKKSVDLKQQYKNYRVFDNPEEETNSRQIQDKSRTNLGQTTDDIETKLKTNLGQKTETQDKTKTEPRTQIRTNLGQTRDKPRTNSSFISLVGLQRNIVVFLYELCKSSRDTITNPLSIEHLAISCNTTKISAQKTIQRLENKGVLKRADFKIGRGGWTRYEIPESIYQEILYFENHNKLSLNLGQTQNKPKSEPRTQIRTQAASSSGINNINKTTTTSEGEILSNPNMALTDEWVKIDIEPLNSIGFTKTHLNQIASQNKIQPKIVQDSINAFAFDLQENARAKTIKGDPINFFMGIVRNGRPYLPPSNYESPQDKAMRIYLERMREIEQKRVEEEKEAFNLAFNDWFLKLSNEQKRELLPEMLRRGANLETSKMLENTAKSHFEKEIWAINKIKIISQE